MIKVTINSQEIEVKENSTILEVAKSQGIHIPTLCHLNLHNLKTVNEDAKCRVCVVEVEGNVNLVPACATKVIDKMIIKTNSPKVTNARRLIVELILSNHPNDCLICTKNKRCDLQSLASDLGINEIKYKGQKNKYKKDTSSLSFVRDLEKCILCGRCETMCSKVQTVGVYSRVKRGFNTLMTTAYDEEIVNSPCTYCGQCVSVCPTGALSEVDNTGEVLAAINNEEKFVIVQTAPAIRAALGEAFGSPIGTNVTKKMITALRTLGFDKVYDTNFAADLTVMEETKELLNRLNNGGKLPLLTTCCPAWINFIEYNYPSLLDIPSTCKSPQEMFGAIAKTYLAKKLNIDPKNMIVVAIMPCLAKKYEAAREELSNEGLSNVDYVLSTRELAKMIKFSGIDFQALSDGSFDEFMGESSGASTIFGVTGGVIEAVVRNAAYILENKKLDRIDFHELRGMQGIREAKVKIKGVALNIAIAHGLGNARILLDKVKSGESKYHAIEIMACPSGCIGGGGQPYYLNINKDILKLRAKCIYNDDRTNKIRVSSENTEIKRLYKEFLNEKGEDFTHELLHTKYGKKK